MIHKYKINSITLFTNLKMKRFEVLFVSVDLVVATRIALEQIKKIH